MAKERVWSGDVGGRQVRVACWAVARLCGDDVEGDVGLAKGAEDLSDVVEGDGGEELRFSRHGLFSFRGERNRSWVRVCEG